VDAIVVLTGGKGRIDEGLSLLLSGIGKHLYISGVDEAVTREELFKNFPLARRFDSCCLTLGYEAKNTRGNADEVAAWVMRQHFHSIIVVTAHYHMPRSLMMVEQRLPNVTVYPWVLPSEDIDMKHWYQDPHTLKILGTEYIKLVLTLIHQLF
jgi:uncharacterized SAM-binding protein YcdF (DUF218 family)